MSNCQHKIVIILSCHPLLTDKKYNKKAQALFKNNNACASIFSQHNGNFAGLMDKIKNH